MYRDFRVRWELDLRAKSPVDAAKYAREAQLDAQSILVIFEVKEEGSSTWVEVDLLDYA